MKTVKSESDMIPRSFPDIKRLIQNVQIDLKEDKNTKCECGQVKVSNRQVGMLSSNYLNNKCCCQRLQQPIILEKKNRCSESKKTKKYQPISDVPQRAYYSPKTSRPIKQVQKFQPIVIPTSDKKVTLVQPRVNTNLNGTSKQQIQIHLDNTDKDCLKKLFKKIGKLTDELHQSEKKNTALSTELQYTKNNLKRVAELEKQNTKLRSEIQKLKAELVIVSSKTIEKIVEKPIEVIKHVPVQKIVQVQVPKYIPGPQKIIEKIVEVPYQIVKQVIKQTKTRDNFKGRIQNNGTPLRKEFSTNLQYFQPPIYKHIPYPFQVPIQVPIHVPFLVQKQIYKPNPDGMGFLQTRTSQMSDLQNQNGILNRQNEQLYRTIEVLKKHNMQKNRQVESLIQGGLSPQPIFTPTLRTEHQFSPRTQYQQTFTNGFYK